MRRILRKIFNIGTLSFERRDHYQKIIRDWEWNSIKEFIPDNCSFLDVGCGAGYNMQLASNMGCTVTGVDPKPYAHGVGRDYGSGSAAESGELEIIEGMAESLPFDDSSFDVVFSSHVLEHVPDKEKALKEMSRVTNEDGRVVIGVPTATMAWINLFSQLLFNTHKRVAYFLAGIFMKVPVKIRFVNIFIPKAHSFSDKTIFYDLKTFRIRNWTSVIGNTLDIEAVLMPALYPFPDFVQLFRIRKSKRKSSSVFFICKPNTRTSE